MKNLTTLLERQYIRVISADGWDYVERPNAQGIVTIIATTRHNQVLLVEQYRPPLDAACIELPAGLVGDLCDESVVSAAERELWEETGFRSSHMVELVETAPSAGLCAEIQTMVRAFGAVRVADGGGVDGEDICVHLISLDDMHGWLEARRREGKAIATSVYAGLYFATIHSEN